MAWKATFDKGVTCVKRGDFEQALVHMNEATELQSRKFTIYESRAVVHEKLGNIKAALHDAKRVVRLAPKRWQGYARAARLYGLLEKHDHSIKMADQAVSHLRPKDAKRRAELAELRENAAAAQAIAEKEWLSQVAQTCSLGKLPVETLVEIFSMLISGDHTRAVTLSHVCGHWRRILVNIPSAWQTLVLSKRHPLRKAKVWKERANKNITHISVDIPELDITSVLATLRDLSWDSLSSLRISSTAFIELHQMLSNASISVPHTFSKLDELTLHCHTPDPLSRFLSSPMWKLRVLRLTGNVSMEDKWWWRIHSSRKYSGELFRFSPRVFTANPSLETFVLNCSKLSAGIIHQANHAGTASTSMNNLKIIKLKGVSHPLGVLHGISAPSISHFSLESATMAEETILRFAGHPSLVELHIVSCSLLPVTLPIILSFTPNLETLHISNVEGIVNEMLDYLTPATVDSPRGLPCPALKHVDVSHCSDLATSSLHAFVKTRVRHSSESVGLAGNCAAIVSLNVVGCPNIEVDMLPWFSSQVVQFSFARVTRDDVERD